MRENKTLRQVADEKIQADCEARHWQLKGYQFLITVSLLGYLIVFRILLHLAGY